MPQFNRTKQPKGQKAHAEGRSPGLRHPGGVPHNFQPTNFIDTDDLPEMAVGPQKVNCTPKPGLLSQAERGTVHLK